MDAKLKETRWQKEFEQPIYEEWKQKKAYRFDRSSKKPIFSIDTPPPYVNTPIHIGHATTYTLMDMFARFHRMLGENVLFPLGLDRNGLPIELAAEKKFAITLTGLSREQAMQYCEKILEESSAASADSFLRLGISFNSWELGDGVGDMYHTDSPAYRALTQQTFADLWEKGLIYEDERVNNWSPGIQTTIADAEIEYEDLPSFFNEVKFRVKETGEEVIIGTTRPELLCSCGMVIFHPDDERYQHLDGKTAITPLYDREVPIKAHPAASIDKGTGIMMMCSFGDVADIRFFREQNLEPVIAISRDGTMNEKAGFLQGQPVAEARKAIALELERKGLLAKKTRIKHRTPICERSKVPIEFIAMPEFYLRQVDFKAQMKDIVQQLNFFAPRSRQILLDWIDSVSIDWPISRRRYYGTEIPVWYDRRNGHTALGTRGTYVRPWKEQPPADAPVYDAKRKKMGTVNNFPGSAWEGETRIFDTWFDSSLSPLYILKYRRDDAFFHKAAPCTLRPQGREIIRTWLYYTLLKDFLLTGKVIFKDVWINYYVVDDAGKKMSKSKGNVIDPHVILEKYGAEPFRLWCATEGNITTSDFRCSFDRIEGAGKTLIKLWNVARFVSLFPKPEGKAELTPLDNWICSELDRLLVLAKKHYAAYDMHTPATQLKHFLWETFASHYLELVKNRAYNEDGHFTPEEQAAALETLHSCLEKMLLLLAPIVPMITARLYHDLYGKDIHAEQFPTPSHAKSSDFTGSELEDLNRRIWKEHNTRGISLKASIREAVIPEKFRTIENDLKAAHNIASVSYGDELKLIF